jgi:glycosyltransferase involved in cell wall biosynthesis
MPAMRVAYFVNRNPSISHTFIRREMAALETQGLEIHRFAARRPETPLTDPEDQKDMLKTCYLLEGNAKYKLVIALFFSLIYHPCHFAKALRLAFICGRYQNKGWLRSFAWLAEAAALRQHCRTRKIDHCHAHFGTNPASVVMLCDALGGPGYSFTVHGPEEFDATASLCLSLKIHRSRFVVAITDYCKSQLCRLVDHPDYDKIKIVHCGVDRSLLLDTKPLPAAPPYRFLAIGRLVEQKGFMVLLEALRILKHQQNNFSVEIIGDGPFREPMEAFVRHHQLDVSFMGWRSGEAISNALDNCHALILPSFAEGLPVVIMEAFARRRPVLATWIAGIPELVNSDKNGILFPPGNPQALSKAISKVLGISVEQLEAMGRQGQEIVKEQHIIDTEAGKLAAYFMQTSKSGALSCPA